MWDETGLVIYYVDPGQYDLAGGSFDAEDICRRIREGGGNAVKLVAHSDEGYVFYPSEYALLAPGYELGRDYVWEIAQACRRHGLKLVLAVSVASNRALAQSRVDWRQITPDGTPHAWGSLPVMCLNTEYAAYIADILRDLVVRYFPDCLCLDNVALLDGCRCPGCVAAFWDDTGLDLATITPGTPEALRYQEWRFESLERLVWQLAMAAKSVRGETAVILSGIHWSPARDRATGWRPERTIAWADGLESALAPHWYEQSLEDGDLLGAYHRALGKQGWLWIEYSPLPYALLACSAEELRLKAATVLAGGGRPCVRPLLPMPPAEDSGLRVLGELFAQFTGHEDCLNIQGSFARTAVLLSHHAAEVTGIDNDGVVRAWCTALSRQHILWDFVLDHHLDQDRLSQYRLLIVPDTPLLEQRALAALEDFMRQGGSVLFLGRATGFGKRGEPLLNLRVADLLGIQYVAPPQENTIGYLQVREPSLTNVVGNIIPVGATAQIRLTSAQAMAYVILAPADARSLPKIEDTLSPGLTWQAHGGGRAAYLAATLESVLGGVSGTLLECAERLVGDLVRWLGGERLRVTAPPEVIVQAYRSPGGATLHLLNRASLSGGRIPQPVPVRSAEIIIPQTLYAAEVHALDGSEVHWESATRMLRIEVPQLKDYCCLHIEGAFG
ncbi:MAG: beta-galactosidase trimerization domain-containing protein [Candidatus Zipacnadales bacterium]